METTALQDQLIDLFTRLCGEPDNAELAAAADRALHDLDASLEARMP